MTALMTLPQEIATVVLVAILAFSMTWALASWLIDDAEPDPFDAGGWPIEDPVDVWWSETPIFVQTAHAMPEAGPLVVGFADEVETWLRGGTA